MFTEYGVPRDDSRWLAVLDSFLNYIDADPSILGGTYWGSGPWWGTYPLSIEPLGGSDAPQVSVLKKHTSTK